MSPGNYPTQEIDKLCPTCQQYHKTPDHLLKCPIPKCNVLQQKLWALLTMLSTEHNLDPNWHQRMWLGLTYPDGTIKHMTDLYPQAFHPIHHRQQKLGWKQMFYGRFLTQWTHLLHVTQPDLDPTKCITKTIIIVWQCLLKVWKA